MEQLVDRARLTQPVPRRTPVNDLMGDLCLVMLKLNVTSSGLVEYTLAFPKLRAKSVAVEANKKKRKRASENTGAFGMSSWFTGPQSPFAHVCHGPRKKGVCTCGADKDESSSPPLCCLY